MRLRTLREIAREHGLNHQEVSTAVRLLEIETFRAGRAITVDERQYVKLRPHLERLRVGHAEPLPASA